MSVTYSESRKKGNSLIVAQAQRQVHTFFDELKNGTKDYRTIASMGEQVTQEYRGRCVLELLQNAYDVLEKFRQPSQVFFMLKTSPEPMLLIGNTGAPFYEENFEGLCQLSQSPKDPNRSVGNKGLGFRSVLEVSTSPEIWSTPPIGSDTSFVFRFDHSISERVAASAQELEEKGLDAHSPFDSACHLLDWTEEQLRTYYDQIRRAKLDAFSEARRFLSPYKFPLPISGMRPEVESLLEQGYVTVICLPLDGGSSGTPQEAIQSVKDQLRALNAQSIVFLSHVERLTIDIDGDQCIIERVVESDVEFSDRARSRQQRMLVEQSGLVSDDHTTREFQVWTRVIGGEDDPKNADYIRTVVKDLPNRWPEVHRVTVGVAVEKTPSPNEGFFVIFLPTETATGTKAHINAPFYGSLNRRHIDFRIPYNEFLLDSVLDLCLDAVTGLVSEESEEWPARAVVDLLSSTAAVDGEKWSLMDKLVERASVCDNSLNGRGLILCSDGWCVPSEARLMPDLPDNTPISVEQWRKYAEFAAVSTVLDERRAAVEALLTQLKGSLSPTSREWLRTIEQMAANVKTPEINVTWDAFLKSVVDVLPKEIQSEWYGALHPLAAAKFLPDQDERLLSASGPIKLFFRPVQGVDDAADFSTKVPDSLKERIAFLHSDVQIHQENQRRKTPVQKFLDDGRFVRNFGREDILREVVKPAAPQLPVAYGSKEADLCSDLLVWTFQLLGEDPRENWLSFLRQLPVACHGGWFPMDEAAFGPGWTDRLGDDVWRLVEELPEGAAARLRETILLPPDDPRWGNAVADKDELFARMGVIDGLRLQKTSELQPFYMSGTSYQPPPKAPADISQELWDDWCKDVRKEMKPHFIHTYEYILSDIHFLPEIYHLETLRRRGRKALTRLLLFGLVHWPNGWQKAKIKKRRGKSWSCEISSPLSYWLAKLPWLSEENAIEQPLSLSHRWLVSSTALQRDRFGYIDPLSVDLALKLEAEPELKAALVTLGLNIYPGEGDQTGLELLEALAAAWGTGRVPTGSFDVFLMQVRHGWQHLDPLKGLPELLLVRTGCHMFLTRCQHELANVYLPDDRERKQSLLEHGKHVLEMHSSDADRMAEALCSATDIRRSSTLEERILIDGTHWDGVVNGIPPLEETRYAWLPVPLLAIAAYGGHNPAAGTERKPWHEAVNRLRRIHLLECVNIDVQLVDGNESVVASKREAQLLPDNVLAVRRNVQSSYQLLASATQAILQRQDILKDIRLVLGILANQENPTYEHIVAALGLAEIDAEAVADVRHQWASNTNLLVDRIWPVLALLGISRDGLDEAATNSKRLTEWLSSNLRQWPANDVLSAARKSRDDHDMGLAAWSAIGDVAQLPAWNTALSELGERYASVENRKTQEQTDEHIEAVTPLLRGLARHIAVETGNPDLFRAFETVIQKFEGSVDWPTKWWKVPFGAVIDALHIGYAKILGAKCYLKVLEGVDTVDDLNAAFQEQGIAIEPGPYEIARQNQERFGGTLSGVYDLYRTWAELNDREPIVLELVELPKLDAEAYLRQLSDAELLEQALRAMDDNEFDGACDGCASLGEIRTHLGLDPKAVEVWRRERREREQEAERQNRTFDVAGKSFEAGITSFSELSEHIFSLDDPVGPHASQGRFTPLATLPSVSQSGESRDKVSKTFNSRPSPEKRELVGITGEIHAYRYLRKEFGSDTVTLDAWVSEIRLKARPLVPGEPDNTDDGHGFDFRFRHCDKWWYVEVKSTTGDDQQFDLGISEIKAASRFAQGQGGSWQILRVRNALSVQPEFDWLPNPFKEEFKSFFHLHIGGMRVSYARKKT